MEAATSFTPSERRVSPLEGKLSQVIPYSREHFARGYLAHVWKQIEDDGASLDIFYAKLAFPPTEPVDVRGDVQDFIQYFASPERMLFHVEQRDSREMAGIFWLDDIILGHRATVNLFFRPGSRGRIAFEAGRIFRDFCCEQLGFLQLWGVTPWKHSVAMGRWLGMKPVAVLPRFARINGELLDVHVIRYEKANG